MRRLIFSAGLLVANPARAHGIERHAPGWTFSPEIMVPLAILLALFAVGTARLWARSGRGRPVLRGRAILFSLGWSILALAVVSPLHEGGEQSFTLHMIEHELVMLPAALLLVAARPGASLLWGLPRVLRQGLGSFARWPVWGGLTSAVSATLLQAIVLVGWHLPALFDRALKSEGWHTAQHLSFLASALLFWWSMLQRHDGAGRLRAALCLFLTSMVGGALGALMALANSPWYAAYAAMPTRPLGLSPVEDQQLAGIIMWVPGGLFHLAAALLLVRRALSRRQPQKFSTTAYATVATEPSTTSTPAQSCQPPLVCPEVAFGFDMKR